MPYPSRGTWRFRNVTGGFDFAPILDSISIEELHPDGLSTFSARVRDTDSIAFANEDRVWVKFEGDKIWAGHVKVRSRTFLDPKGQREKLWEIRGQDYTSKLEDSVITTRGERERESAADRVAFILTHLNFSITTVGVDLPSESVEPAELENMTVREALQQVADELVLHFYIDFGPDDGGAPDLHMFRTETFDAPFDLTDDEPDYSTTFPYSEFDIPDDSQDLKTAVRVRGDRIRRWVTDPTQIATYGRQETPVTDSNLRTLAQVKAAGRRVLDQNDRPEVHGTLLCHEPGLRAGMRFGLVNTPWSIDTNYIAEQVSISAVNAKDSENKAELFSRVSFTDKRRVGRMPGGGRSRGGGTGGGGGGGRGGGGDGRHPPGSGGGGHTGTGGGHGKCGCPVDLTEIMFDDFDRIESEALGSLPVPDDERAWWSGGNPWGEVIGDGAPDMDDFGVDGSSFFVESSTVDALYQFTLLPGDGDLPMEGDEWELLIRWRLTTEGSGIGERYAFFDWGGPNGMRLSFNAELSGEGIMVTGDGTDFVTKTLTAGVWHLVRWRFDSVNNYARVWVEDDDEPGAWDVENPIDTTFDPDAIGFRMFGALGNASGPAQRFEVDWIKVVIPAASGELVEKSIAHGSGGIIDVGEAYEPNTLTVRVDDDKVTPDSFDPPAGTADLGEDVYHDPSDHPGGCASVTVSYRKA